MDKVRCCRHDRSNRPSCRRAREALVEDWFESHQRGERALMIAHRRRDVAELNDRARAKPREADQLGRDQLEVNDRGFAVGGRVVTTRHDRPLDVVNGTAVPPADHEAHFLERELDRAREHLTEVETRLDGLEDERQQTRWYQRGRRAELDTISEGWQRGHEHWQTEVDRLGEALAERPHPPEPELV